jgi:tetratricopeptide (TPR) repeat protein
VQMAYYKGRLLLARGEAAAARDSFRAAVDVFEKRNSRLALRVFALIGLSRAQLALGDTPDAAARAARAIEVASSLVEPGTPSYLIGLSQAAHADAQLAAGRRDEAQAGYRAALDHLETTLGKDHPATVAAIRSLTLPGQARSR